MSHVGGTGTPESQQGNYRDSSCRDRQWKRGPVEADGQPKVDRGTLRLMRHRARRRKIIPRPRCEHKRGHLRNSGQATTVLRRNSLQMAAMLWTVLNQSMFLERRDLGRRVTHGAPFEVKPAQQSQTVRTQQAPDSLCTPLLQLGSSTSQSPLHLFQSLPLPDVS